ncbi:ROK family transcriptional regulator [Sphingomonas xinjiangensis]|uniref:Putative NBD/HSP70 family sugar kinase n=1 Tax=Sphingomonas xinjiangensis TaxID=643568 RepID=A0A840YSL6_9SPHN|nr:ROK family transcriptional regulator [Sphingomonas xinjiangensis]MBB5712665.1 putative NBD/HSP70 family sugar kinase [Sphingomonas xinjiangensis]
MHGLPQSSLAKPGRSDGRGARLSRTLSGTNLARAGDYNLRTVLQSIRLAPGTTRIDIALQTGLTGPTIANITGRLIDMGLVQVTGRRKSGRGQPAILLEVVPEGAFGIGLNIDRDHLTLVTLDLAGTVRCRVTREIAFPLPADVLRFLADEWDDALAISGIDPARVLGMGVAVPDDMGRIVLPHQPPGYAAWNGTDLVSLLADAIPWPIHCDNDAAAAALGEAEYGSAFDNPSFFYMLVSAGLGGGLVIDRNYHRGASARSGEIGLMPDAARAGAQIQDTVSVSALLDRLERAGHRAAEIGDLLKLESVAPEILERWLEDAVRSLVAPLTAINCLLNPDAVLIGGRLPLPLIERLAEALTRALAEVDLPARAPVKPAVMAQDAPAIGAAILPFLDHLLPSDSILIQAGR